LAPIFLESWEYADARARAFEKDLEVLEDLQGLSDLLMYGSNTLGLITIIDRLMYQVAPQAFMRLLHRGLAPGGLLMTLTPSTDGRGAFAHPPAKSFWNEFSFSAYTTGDGAIFEPVLLKTFYPTQWHVENNINYVQANLRAIKDDA
jgi:SAM-dependent methyltransferase